jgi:fatty-acyl-CoA synthase
MVKSGGENVASREVEETIYRMPQVAEVAVVGVPHPRWVEAVVAVIVVRAGQPLSQDAVLGHCAQHLASFKVPKAVVFADTLPKNPSGKLLKRELRQHHAGLFSREGQ